MSMIELKSVSYKYPLTKTYALKEIDFKVEKGEFVALIGRNGSGKTTLCNVIRGIIPHFQKGKLSGEILIDGTPLKKMELGDIARKIGLVFQNPFIQVSGVKETVFEEILFGLENLGIEREEMIRRTEEMIAQLKIEDLRDKNPLELSGGQRQRVAIASVLVMKPDILLIDEPTSQLDPQGTEEVFETIQLMKDAGITIILVEHKINFIAEYADRIITLDKGELVLEGDVSEVLTNPKLNDYGVALPEVVELAYQLQEKKNLKLNRIPITLEQGKIVFSELR